MPGAAMADQIGHSVRPLCTLAAYALPYSRSSPMIQWVFQHRPTAYKIVDMAISAPPQASDRPDLRLIDSTTR
jgi:hypothetical protein